MIDWLIGSFAGMDQDGDEYSKNNSGAFHDSIFKV